MQGSVRVPYGCWAVYERLPDPGLTDIKISDLAHDEDDFYVHLCHKSKSTLRAWRTMPLSSRRMSSSVACDGRVP